MKVSELIQRLEELKEKHGDLPIHAGIYNQECDLQFVGAYTHDGCVPTEDSPAVEVYLHIFNKEPRQ